MIMLKKHRQTATLLSARQMQAIKGGTKNTENAGAWFCRYNWDCPFYCNGSNAVGYYCDGFNCVQYECEPA